MELRVGTVVEVMNFGSQKARLETSNRFWRGDWLAGPCAQITDLYDADDLLGRQVVAVVNPQKQIGPIMSECLWGVSGGRRGGADHTGTAG